MTACLVAFAGCTNPERDAASAKPALPSAADGGMPPLVAPESREPLAEHTATRLTISGLSRVERRSLRNPLIDLRLDAVDRANAPARLGGAMRVTVRAAGAEPDALVFDLPMRTAAEAERRYDPTLRQYVLRVEPVWKKEPPGGSTLEVTATLALADGGALEATTILNW